jgi:hypothetical protein
MSMIEHAHHAIEGRLGLLLVRSEHAEHIELGILVLDQDAQLDLVDLGAGGPCPFVTARVAGRSVVSRVLPLPSACRRIASRDATRSAAAGGLLRALRIAGALRVDLELVGHFEQRGLDRHVHRRQTDFVAADAGLRAGRDVDLKHDRHQHKQQQHRQQQRGAPAAMLRDAGSA